MPHLFQYIAANSKSHICPLTVFEMCCLLGKLIPRPHLPAGVQTGVSTWGASCRKPTLLWVFHTSAFLRLKMWQFVKWSLPGNHKIYTTTKLMAQLEVTEKSKCHLLKHDYDWKRGVSYKQHRDWPGLYAPTKTCKHMQTETVHGSHPSHFYLHTYMKRCAIMCSEQKPLSRNCVSFYEYRYVIWVWSRLSMEQRSEKLILKPRLLLSGFFPPCKVSNNCWKELRALLPAPAQPATYKRRIVKWNILSLGVMLPF